MEEKEWLFHVVLVEPEIPPNTGNIARTCAITGMKLHLVKPLGFSIDDKAVKRAGLDYWDHLELEVHESLGEFLEKYKDRKMYLATTHGGVRYTDVRYERGSFLLFGKETAGTSKRADRAASRCRGAGSDGQEPGPQVSQSVQFGGNSVIRGYASA